MEIGLRESLILARQAIGKWYIINRTRTKLRDEYSRDVVEGARVSGSDVEHAPAYGAFGKCQVHANDIVHENKIAPLFSVRVSVGAVEQSRAPTRLQLPIQLIHHRRHFALVGLVRTIDVEIPKTGDGALRAGGDAADMIVA